MLRLENIKKDYKVADNYVPALKGIDLAFRKSEFVSILGPSGCGKTTLLNIIGGLDKYTDGNLSIGGRSTKEFSSRDWDVYRNHRIGFIFQSYNLIPHQTILENVELALTIAGMSKELRVEKAKKALDRVGLKGQYNKKPNQLSGGQCQRVAIARALVNEPEILLADEPTGALDTVTSVQIMELIKDISKEKLVIMVTHNPELANQYSTRIVKLLDGLVLEDSNPFTFDEEMEEVNNTKRLLEQEKLEETKNLTEKQIKKYEKNKTENAKMSFFTAFKLSARNLRSKFKRTAMVVVAGSIGIIGVTTVLAVSRGVKDYIVDMQDDMLSGNPITIGQMAIDMQSLMSGTSFTEKKEALEKGDWVNVNSIIGYLIKNEKALDSLVSNNEISKDYIDYILNMPKEDYNAISLNYGVDMTASIYTDFNSLDPNQQAKTEKLSLNAINQMYSASISKLGNEDEVTGEMPYAKYASAITSLTSPISQSVPNNDYILSQYDVIAGDMPKNENECILVLNKDQELTDLVLAQLGYYSQREFYDMIYSKMGIEGYTSKNKFTYKELMKKEFKWMPNNEIYSLNTGVLAYLQNDILTATNELKEAKANGSSLDKINELQKKVETVTQAFMNAENIFDYKYKMDESVFENNDIGKKLTVAGIVKPKDNISYGCLSSGLLYSESFTRSAIKENLKSNIVEFVKNTRTIQLNGKETNLGIKVSYKLPFYWESKIDGIEKEGDSIYNAYVGKGNAMQSIMQAYGLSSSSLGGSTMSLAGLGGFTDKSGNVIPESISIYPVNFKQKDKVTDYLDRWNKLGENGEDITFNVLNDDLTVKYDESGNIVTKTLHKNATNLDPDYRTEIKYTDQVGLIIGMINTMINIITYALVAFTALSLLVSTVMVGIITYVSVVERVKEIGVIRSLGGRKKDVSHLFNAETFMIGLLSGVFGILVTGVLSLIINLIVKGVSSGAVKSIAHLTISTAIVMIVLSIVLTLISGLIPARSAAKKDPVNALRSE